MDSAHVLFETLRSFRQSTRVGSSPQQLLFNYCEQVLGAVERLHIDFKEKQGGPNEKLGDSDKRNIAKAVSGFANSSGGVLIWGIEDERITP